MSYISDGSEDLLGDDSNETTNLINSVLRLFGTATSRKTYLDELSNILKNYTGCNYIGIRVLDRSGNIPYHSYAGFSETFIQNERWLCLDRDQCICTRVVSGDQAPEDIRYSTKSGSFYCNDTKIMEDTFTGAKSTLYRGKCFAFGFRSLAVIPILYKESVLGVIHLADVEEGKVPFSVISVIESLVKFIAEAMNRFSVEEELQRKYDIQRIINKLLSLSHKNMDIKELLKQALLIITSISWLKSETPMGGVFLSDSHADTLSLVAHVNLPEAVVQAYEEISISKCLCGKAIRSQQIQLTESSNLCSEHKHALFREHYQIPIVASNKTLGFLILYPSTLYRRRVEEEQYLTTVSRFLWYFIEHKQYGNALRKSELNLAQAQRIANIGHWDWDIENNHFLWSEEIFRILGQSSKDANMAYETFMEFVHPGDKECVRTAFNNAWRNNAEYSLEHRINRPDGSVRLVYQQIAVTVNKENRVIQMFGTVQDITESRRAEREIEFQASLLEQVSDAVIATDIEGRIVYWNRFAERLYLFSKEEVIGKPIFDVTVPVDGQAIASKIMGEIIKTGQWKGEFITRRRDGSVFPAEVRLSVINDDDGELSGVIGVSNDISERKEFEKKLLNAHQRLLDIIDFLPDATYVVDQERKVIAWNHAMEWLTGVSKNEIVNKDNYKYALPFYETSKTVLLDRVFMGRKEDECSYTKRERLEKNFILEDVATITKEGEKLHLWCFASPLLDTDGNVVGAIETIRDVTTRKRTENQLQHLMTHDSLTNIANRFILEQNLERVMAKARRGVNGALLIIDIDDFSQANEILGHEAGDEYLIRLVEILKDNLREEDLIARFGADQFALLIEDIDEETARAIGEKLRRKVLDERFRVNMSISVGIAMIEGSSNVKTILSQASVGLDRAKEAGKNSVVVNRASEESIIELSESHKMLRIIKSALAEGKFTIRYQPIFDIYSNKIIHHEGLIRLLSTNNEVIYPDEFIPIAEKYGLMPQIDQWVSVAALNALNRWPNLNLFINLSGVSLGDKDLLESIALNISESAVDPTRLGFEITETAAVKNIDFVNVWINKLKKMGCLFALDDFGIGFSSLSYLKTLTVDFVKIDGSFVYDLDKDFTQQALVQSINTTAHVLGKKTIAEFVENDQILKVLKSLKVDFGQGYYFGEPKEFPMNENEL